MDVIGGLTAAKLALDLVKDLRDIDKSVDEATFKLKLAELTSALADTKVAFSDAKIELQERAETIQGLKKQLEIATNGETCPKCLTGRLKLGSTQAYPYNGLNAYGVEQWQFNCSEETCEFQMKRLHDPHGAIPKMAAKR